MFDLLDPVIGGLSRLLRSGPRIYGTELQTFVLEGFGEIRYHQWLHPKETHKEITDADVKALRLWIRPGDLVVDVGAHTGDTTLPLALAAGPEGRVVALEPNPHVFEVLRRNAAANPELTRIDPLPVAATEDAGTFTFQYSDPGFCNGGFLESLQTSRHGHRWELEVEGVRLGRLLRRRYTGRLDRFSFLKVDAEGYDRAVLASMRELLDETRPVIVTEVYKRLVEEERTELLALLEGLGYRCRRATGWQPVGPELRAGDLIAEDNFDLIAVPASR